MCRPVLLLVEDDELTRRIMMKSFEKEGVFEVIPAADPFEALRIFSKRKIDLLLTDWDLRDRIDGMQMLAKMQRRRLDLRAIVWSGRPAVEEEAEKRGAICGVRKGVRDNIFEKCKAALSEEVDVNKVWKSQPLWWRMRKRWSRMDRV